jgi:hypothetical protein
MRWSEKFLEQLEQDYLDYLADMPQDEMPMSQDAYEWMRIRDILDDREELKMCDM